MKKMLDILKLIDRSEELFTSDLKKFNEKLEQAVKNSTFLVIGGAGTIGQAVTKEIFKRNPKALNVVDISENNLVELVRDIRSSLGYIDGDFKTFAIDCGSREFEVLFNIEESYDYILNLSALKHVRSEKDPYTLMRMVDVNILNPEKVVSSAISGGTSKYFCVSTDKAANPVNMMGASKRIMEMYLMRSSEKIPVSTARFANVAFSDGSLLHGFNQRIMKNQPLSAPKDVKRYFVTPQESGQLCLMACLMGENCDNFFPKLSEKLHQLTFAEIAVNYLKQLGYEAYPCETEEEARSRVEELKMVGKWPCYFFNSDTTGEKDYEEFYTEREVLDLERFEGIGIIKNEAKYEQEKLDYFSRRIAELKQEGCWSRNDLVQLFHDMIPGFKHKETGKFLDGRM